MSTIQTNFNRRSTEETDAVLYLHRRYPHIIEEIFGQLVDEKTCPKVQKIPQWEEALLTVWKNRWRRNVEQIPLWKALSSRAENNELYFTNKSNHLDTDYYRKLYRHITDSLRKIETNFKNGLCQEPQTITIHFSKDKTNVLSQRRSVPDKINHVRVNHKHLFIVLQVQREYEIKALNRWTLTSVGCQYKLRLHIKDIQVNSRVVVIQCGWDSNSVLRVLDADTIGEIQLIDENLNDDEPLINSEMINSCFNLTEDLLYHAVIHAKDTDENTFLVTITSYRFLTSVGRFETLLEQKFEFQSVSGFFSDPKMYVDDRYVIFEWITEKRFQCHRQIQVRCRKTMELVHERKFRENLYIKREYKDGLIVTELKNAIGKRCVVVWDVHKNKIRPIAGHSSDHLMVNISSSMTYFTNYQALFFHEDQFKVQLIDKMKKKVSLKTIFSLLKRTVLNFDPFNLLRVDRLLYCDGIQAIGTYRSARGDELLIANMI